MPKTVKIGNQVIDPENPGIDRPVVIKEFEVDDPGAERAIEMLSYGFSCVPKLYHVEKNQDSVKIYQEFIEGTHLYDLNPGTLPEVLDCVTEVARALRLVHKQAEAVRDITPDNIIFRDGQAYFIDLSTTNTEYTPGFKPPEVDGGLTGGYCRASDIYQLGLILRSLLLAAGSDHLPSKSLVEQCLASEPGERPSAEVLFKRLGAIQIELSKPKARPLFKWLILLFPFMLTAVILDSVMVSRANSNRVDSFEDVVELRAKVADLSLPEREEASLSISEFLTEETLLTKERIDALFITKNPLIICDGKSLGLGSNVRFGEGNRGYVVGLSYEGVQIKTDEDVVNFNLGYWNMRGGFSRHRVIIGEPLEKNIFIREKHRNLSNIINGAAKHIGLKVKGEIAGATAGLYEADTVIKFLDLHKNKFKISIENEEIVQFSRKPPLFFPVQGVWLHSKCEYLELYLGANVENCNLMKENQPLFSYSSNLDEMLLVYNLLLEETSMGYKIVHIN